jgi:hypothetical protein
MRQQFKVLAGKAKRSGRLQEVALFDEAGEPLSLGSNASIGDRGWYYALPGSVSGTGPTVALEWDPTPGFAAGDSLLDFADPEIPVVLRGGIYAVSIHAWFPKTAGKVGRLSLDLDANDLDPAVVQEWPLDGSAPSSDFAYGATAMTWYIPEGGGIQSRVKHNNDTNLLVYAEMLVQPIAYDS